MINTIRNIKTGSIVASDLNGTLTTGSPVLAVHRWLAEHQPGAAPPLFLVWLTFTFLMVKTGLLKIDIWGELAMAKVLGFIQSPDPDLLDAVMTFVVEDELWPKRRDEPVSLLRKMHQEGAEIWILSAAYQPAVAKFAGKIAPQRTHAIGTPIQITSAGVEFSGPLNSREKKISSFSTAIGPQPLAVALGDTFADIPFLQSAEQAIAVYPDRQLKQMALKNDWQIIG